MRLDFCRSLAAEFSNKTGENKPQNDGRQIYLVFGGFSAGFTIPTDTIYGDSFVAVKSPSTRFTAVIVPIASGVRVSPPPYFARVQYGLALHRYVHTRDRHKSPVLPPAAGSRSSHDLL